MVREREIYTSSSPSLLFIRLILPAQKAEPVPPLSAILGQATINASDFCNQFNLLSSFEFEPGVIVVVHLFRKPDLTFYFYFQGIFAPFYVFQSADDFGNIQIETLYDIFLLSTLGYDLTPDFYKAKEFFGSIRSINVKVLFLLLFHPLMETYMVASFYYGRSFSAFYFPVKLHYLYTFNFPVPPQNSFYASSSSFVLNYMNKRFSFTKLVNFSSMPSTLREFQSSFRLPVKPYKHFLIPVSMPPLRGSSSLALYYTPDRRAVLYSHFFLSSLSFFFYFHALLLFRFSRFAISGSSSLSLYGYF